MDSMRNEEKLYSCSICAKTFQSCSGLSNHKKLHNGISFQCPVCKLHFTQKGHLKSHMRIHSGEKPFKCEQCTKVFARKDGLQRHVKTEHFLQTWECNVCYKKLKSKQAFTTHNRQHAGDKPFQCEDCDKRFYRKYDVKRHKMKGRCRKIVNEIKQVAVVGRNEKDKTKEANLYFPYPYSADMYSERGLLTENKITQDHLSANVEDFVEIADNIQFAYQCGSCLVSFSCFNEFEVHVGLHENTDNQLKSPLKEHNHFTYSTDELVGDVIPDNVSQVFLESLAVLWN